MLLGMRSKETGMSVPLGYEWIVGGVGCRRRGIGDAAVDLEAAVGAGKADVGIGRRRDHVDLDLHRLQPVGDERLPRLGVLQREAERRRRQAPFALDSALDL